MHHEILPLMLTIHYEISLPNDKGGLCYTLQGPQHWVKCTVLINGKLFHVGCPNMPYSHYVGAGGPKLMGTLFFYDIRT